MDSLGKLLDEVNNMDRLVDMFYRQEQFAQLLNINFNQEYITSMLLAGIVEFVEVLNETPWKPWKKKQDFNREKYLSELVDVQHFLINACLAVGISPKEFYEEFKKKNEENIKRHHDGY